jgi:hypothetical protein
MTKGVVDGSAEHLVRAVTSGDLMDYVEWWKSDPKRVAELRVAIEEALKTVVAEDYARRQSAPRKRIKREPKAEPVPEVEAVVFWARKLKAEGVEYTEIDRRMGCPKKWAGRLAWMLVNRPRQEWEKDQ